MWAAGAIWSSPLTRTVQTALIAFQGHPRASVGTSDTGGAGGGGGGGSATTLAPLPAALCSDEQLVMLSGQDIDEDCSDEEVGAKQRHEISRLWDDAIANRRRDCPLCGWRGASGTKLLYHLRSAAHKKREAEYVQNAPS